MFFHGAKEGTKYEILEKENALIHILEHYGVKQPKMNPAYVEKTRVFKIEIEKYTAKHRR